MRVDYPNRMEQHYEGEQGAERMVRAEFADGEIQFYEGGKGVENYSIRSADEFRGKANVSRIEYLCAFFRAHKREFESPKVSIVSVFCR